MISFTSDQIFIVTGASSGIGECVALLLNELGATVIGIGRNQERLSAMKAKAKHPENVFLEQKDLTEDIDGLPTYVKSLKEKYGKFSGMAYCAGIGAIIPLNMVTYTEAQNVFDINYFCPLMMSKGLLDRRNNIGKGCSVVYISSIAATLPDKSQPVYCGCKAALSISAKCISRQVSAMGIRVNSVSPAMVKTPLTNREQLQNIGVTENLQMNKYPFGWGEPFDVANMVVFLLSDKASKITGEDYQISFGLNK